MANEWRGHCHWFQVFYGSVSLLIIFFIFFLLMIFSGLVVSFFYIFYSRPFLVYVYIADNLHIITINGIIRFYRDLIELSCGSVAAFTVLLLLLPYYCHCCFCRYYCCCNSSGSHCAKWFFCIRHGIVLRSKLPKHFCRMTNDLIWYSENNFNYISCVDIDVLELKSWTKTKYATRQWNNLLVLEYDWQDIRLPEHMDT